MQTVAAALFLVLGAAMVFFIIVYQSLDRIRFFARRQWETLEPLADGWLDCARRFAGEDPDFSAAASEYASARRPEQKSAALRRAADALPNGDYPALRARGQELTEAAYRYNEYVKVLNRRLSRPVFKRTGRLLGFCEMEQIELLGNTGK